MRRFMADKKDSWDFKAEKTNIIWARGIAMLCVDKFPCPHQQTMGD